MCRLAAPPTSRPWGAVGGDRGEVHMQHCFSISAKGQAHTSADGIDNSIPVSGRGVELTIYNRVGVDLWALPDWTRKQAQMPPRREPAHLG